MTRAADTDPAALVAGLARGNAALAATPPAERRIALVLDGGDAARALAVLRALQAAGYRVAGLPASAEELAARLARGSEALMCNDYAAYYASLPRELCDRVEAEWGAAEADPGFRPGEVDCGRLEFRALVLGNVAVAAPETAASDPPPHRRLAFEAWLADSFRAQAALRLEPERAA